MVTQSKVSQEAVVSQHVVPQLLHCGFVLEVKVPLQETFVELNNLAQRQVLARSFVKPSACLDELRASQVNHCHWKGEARRLP